MQYQSDGSGRTSLPVYTDEELADLRRQGAELWRARGAPAGAAGRTRAPLGDWVGALPQAVSVAYRAAEQLRRLLVPVFRMMAKVARELTWVAQQLTARVPGRTCRAVPQNLAAGAVIQSRGMWQILGPPRTSQQQLWAPPWGLHADFVIFDEAVQISECYGRHLDDWQRDLLRQLYTGTWDVDGSGELIRREWAPVEPPGPEPGGDAFSQRPHDPGRPHP